MTLCLQKRKCSCYLAGYILLLPLLFGFFIDFLGISGALRYSVDAAWCALVLLALKRGRLQFDRKLLPLALTAAVFFVYTLALLVFRYQSGVWYLWGVRNNFRFYIAFFSFAACFERRDAERCFRVMEWLFWINFGVSLVQFFLLGCRQDYLGGIFGMERGRNGAYTLLFFCLLLTRSMLAMLQGQEGVLCCFAKCGAAVLVAALAEMFGFFLFFGLAAVLAIVLTPPSRRKGLLMVALGLGLLLGSSLLLRLFGEGSALTVEVVRQRLFAEHYATHEDLGRLTAIPTLARTILTEPLEQLFGLGLGNCDTSTFALCNSEFYQQHADLHYTWFLSAFLFLETGYAGLGLYLLFFVVCLVGALQCMGRGGDPLYCRMGVILSVLSMVLTFYNSALRAEGGYMLYFALALPFLRQPAEEGRDRL